MKKNPVLSCKQTNISINLFMNLFVPIWPIIIMSDKPTSCFRAGVSAVDRQGAVLSSFAPLRVEEHLRPPLLPPRSAYHLIACAHPRLLARAHTHSILSNYLTASLLPHTPVVDLCLPFHEQSSGRTYLGRYIIFKGQIIGLRLSTRVGTLAPEFSCWPRHKTSVASIRASSKTYSIPIGQISLYMGNVRVGLLFDWELETTAQEYVNCGFDLIIVAYTGEERRENGMREAVGGLAREVLVLQGGEDQRWEQEIKGMLYGHGLEADIQKSHIHISYYSFEKIFTTKRRLPLSKIQPQLITPIEIDHTFLQENLPIIPIDNPHYQLIPQRYSLLNTPSFSWLDSYMQRLYLFYKRSGGRKIVVMLQESPSVFLFLYLLHLILGKTEADQRLPFRRIFKFVNIDILDIARLLPKFHKLCFDISNKDKKQRSSSQTTKLIRAFDFIAKAEQNQTFFPVITEEPQTVNVLRMINQRQRLRAEEGNGEQQEGKGGSDSSCECVSKLPPRQHTWIATSFFSETELQSLYFSEEFREIMNDEEWHKKVWDKHCLRNKRKNKDDEEEEEMSLSMIEEKCLAEIIKIQDFLQKNCPLLRQFQKHYSLLNQEIDQQIAFTHFLFRKLTKIDIESSLLQELLATSRRNLFSTYCFLHSRKLSSTTHLSPRAIKNQLALARLQAARKLQCHKCDGVFDKKLMFSCRWQQCGEKFCYDCLIDFKAYSPQQILNEQGQLGRIVKLCPICRGLCIDCHRCSNKREQLTLSNSPYVNANHDYCHYCRSSTTLYLFSCRQCPERFCLTCLEEVFRIKDHGYVRGRWTCLVCQHRCYCNRCQNEKGTVMKMTSKEEPRKGILKKGIKKSEASKQELEEEDDEETNTRLGQPRKQQPSSFHN